MNYQYAYLFGNLFLLFPLWVIIFYFRQDLRKKIIFTSIFGLLITPFFVNWYIKDYWRPDTITGLQLSIEDFLFGFLISGIFSSIYLIIFNKHFLKKRKKHNHWIILVFILLSVIFYFLGATILNKINSIYLTSLESIILCVIITYYRHDLGRYILISGICAILLHLFGYLIFIQFFPKIFDKWWLLENLSDTRIITIPIEEFIWAFGWGMVTSSIYDFYTGLTVE